MCGIAGFNFEDRSLVKRMMQRIEHRGPDQSGSYLGKNITLGHQRLSILDLSTKARQPMANEDGTHTLVYNGEVYNYQEIRAELEQLGYRFKSTSDTEVVLHAYNAYGPACVEKFNGFFAFALWDSEKSELFLARDRFGIKPLYYYFNDRQFIFASEIKAILGHDLPKELNHKAVSQFLSFRCNPLSETLFKNVYKLPPAHTAILKNGTLKLSKYWSIQYHPEKQSPAFYKTLLLKELRASTKYRLISDVPLGVYLSGGLDSSGVVALMNELVDEPIKTFSVGFDAGANVDELSNAQQTASYFETDHQEVIVNPDAFKLLPEIVHHADEPMSDPTSIPTYLLSEQARKKVTVVLTGEGADELFAGYEQYKFIKAYRRYAHYWPHSFKKFMAYAARKFPPRLRDSFFKYASQLGEEGIRRFTDMLLEKDEAHRYLHLVSLFTEEEKKELLPTFISDVLPMARQYFQTRDSFINQMLNFDTHVTLTDNLLMKVDKTTMAHSLEARVPYLDHRVAELAARIPPELKLKGFTGKYILREALKPVLPKEIRERKKDRFFVPINQWIQPQLPELMNTYFDPARVRSDGVLNPDYITKLSTKFEQSPLYYSRQLWSLITFQIWYDTFFKE